MIGENRFNRRSRTRIGCVAPSYEQHARPRERGGTFIQGRRSRGSQNRRGGENGSRSIAVADRNPDPDHPFDLALRRPARLKRALTFFSKPAVLGRPASCCRLVPCTSAKGLMSGYERSLDESAEDSGCADIASAIRRAHESPSRTARIFADLTRCHLRQSTRRNQSPAASGSAPKGAKKAEIDGQRLGTARPFPLWRLGSGPHRCPSIQCSEKSPPEHLNWQHPI